MLTVTRYINGVKVKDKNVKNYTIESEVISKTIQAVNRRLGLEYPPKIEQPQSL
ncbi:MAG: hypothetical protein LBC86_01915 [Oscillospiraceae bacterium]|jgi:hypothetical protein|nr:hypothetical protein [Oscillospiraceae bacterium]